MATPLGSVSSAPAESGVVVDNKVVATTADVRVCKKACRDVIVAAKDVVLRVVVVGLLVQADVAETRSNSVKEEEVGQMSFMML
jgi:hypothetical protein